MPTTYSSSALSAMSGLPESLISVLLRLPHYASKDDDSTVDTLLDLSAKIACVLDPSLISAVVDECLATNNTSNIEHTLTSLADSAQKDKEKAKLVAASIAYHAANQQQQQQQQQRDTRSPPSSAAVAAGGGGGSYTNQPQWQSSAASSASPSNNNNITNPNNNNINAVKQQQQQQRYQPHRSGGVGAATSSSSAAAAPSPSPASSYQDFHRQQAAVQNIVGGSGYTTYSGASSSYPSAAAAPNTAAVAYYAAAAPVVSSSSAAAHSNVAVAQQQAPPPVIIGQQDHQRQQAVAAAPSSSTPPPPPSSSSPAAAAARGSKANSQQATPRGEKEKEKERERQEKKKSGSGWFDWLTGGSKKEKKHKDPADKALLTPTSGEEAQQSAAWIDAAPSPALGNTVNSGGTSASASPTGIAPSISDNVAKTEEEEDAERRRREEEEEAAAAEAAERLRKQREDEEMRRTSKLTVDVISMFGGDPAEFDHRHHTTNVGGGVVSHSQSIANDQGEQQESKDSGFLGGALSGRLSAERRRRGDSNKASSAATAVSGGFSNIDFGGGGHDDDERPGTKKGVTAFDPFPTNPMATGDENINSSGIPTMADKYDSPSFGIRLDGPQPNMFGTHSAVNRVIATVPSAGGGGGGAMPRYSFGGEEGDVSGDRGAANGTASATSVNFFYDEPNAVGRGGGGGAAGGFSVTPRQQNHPSVSSDPDFDAVFSAFLQK